MLKKFLFERNCKDITRYTGVYLNITRYIALYSGIPEYNSV